MHLGRFVVSFIYTYVRCYVPVGDCNYEEEKKEQKKRERERRRKKRRKKEKEKEGKKKKRKRRGSGAASKPSVLLSLLLARCAPASSSSSSSSPSSSSSREIFFLPSSPLHLYLLLPLRLFFLFFLSFNSHFSEAKSFRALRRGWLQRASLYASANLSSRLSLSLTHTHVVSRSPYSRSLDIAQHPAQTERTNLGFLSLFPRFSGAEENV